jgi:hypothetical protein
VRDLAPRGKAEPVDDALDEGGWARHHVGVLKRV